MTLKFKTGERNWLMHVPLELIFWITALALLALAEPADPRQHSHFTLCPLANLGWTWCPGCGLGRSLTQLFHGHVAESLKEHWFGIPALMILGYRIFSLGRYEWKKLKY